MEHHLGFELTDPNLTLKKTKRTENAFYFVMKLYENYFVLCCFHLFLISFKFKNRFLYCTQHYVT